MARLHLENLERRELFHAASLVEAMDSADLAPQASEGFAAVPTVVREAARVAIAAGDVTGDGVFDIDAFTVDSRPEVGVLGWSWGVSNSSTHELVGSTPDVNGPLGYSWGVSQTGYFAQPSPAGGQEGEELAPASVDGRIGSEVGDATPADGVLLPYIEQDNLWKQMLSRDFADGTSNTMMFAPAESAGRVDVWEHAYASDAGPETSGIIAILIGLAADPTDPSGETLSGANHLLGEEPIYYPAANRIVDQQTADTSSSLVSLDDFFAGYDDESVDAEAASSRTLPHWDGLPLSILHEENEFSFPRMFSSAVDAVVTEWPAA